MFHLYWSEYWSELIHVSWIYLTTVGNHIMDYQSHYIPKASTDVLDYVCISLWFVSVAITKIIHCNDMMETYFDVFTIYSVKDWWKFHSEAGHITFTNIWQFISMWSSRISGYSLFIHKHDVNKCKHQPLNWFRGMRWDDYSGWFVMGSLLRTYNMDQIKVEIITPGVKWVPSIQNSSH